LCRRAAGALSVLYGSGRAPDAGRPEDLMPTADFSTPEMADVHATECLQSASLLFQRTGPLTRELLLQPGRFGLGQLPAVRLPDAVADVVCGFCSTGCSLRVHLADGAATNLTPNPNYPVNSGMACPKGWEALSVLSAPDRATVPLLRSKEGKLEPV